LNLIWTRDAYGHVAGEAAQDILNPIPEPASMLLFGSGLAAWPRWSAGASGSLAGRLNRR